MSTHDTYYVPAQSKWPIIATIGMLVTVYGLAVWFNDLKAARPESHGPWIFFVGGLLVPSGAGYILGSGLLSNGQANSKFGHSMCAMPLCPSPPSHGPDMCRT